jgi:hypothetical protein
MRADYLSRTLRLTVWLTQPSAWVEGTTRRWRIANAGKWATATGSRTTTEMLRIVSEAQERHQRAAAAAGGAFAGLVVGGPVGAIAGAALGPLLEPFAQHVWNELHSDAQRRQGEALAAAAEDMGGDPQELERLVLASDGSRLQAGIALSAAARTTWPPKVRALGRALAAGLMATDDARIDTEPLVMAALADVEFPQASLLELLTCHWPRFTREGGFTAEPFSAPARDASAPWAAGQRIWLERDIGLARPTLRAVLPSLLGTLQRHGLATQSDNPGDPLGRTGRALQQRFISDLADRRRTGAGDPAPGLGAIEAYAPAGSWMPTELGEEVLNALLQAGAEFAN